MSRDRKPPKVNDEAMKALEHFLTHWQLSEVEINDGRPLGMENETPLDLAKFMVDARERTCADVRLVFRRKYPSKEKFILTKDSEWALDNSACNAKLYDYGAGSPVSFSIESTVGPDTISIPGLVPFLREKYSPHKDAAEDIFDNDVLENLEHLGCYHHAISTIIEDFQARLKDFSLKNVGNKARELRKQKERRKSNQPVIDRLEEDLSKTDSEYSAIQYYEQQMQQEELR
ncbi:MAG: hypothetical protein AB1847_22835 [bacterium]